MKIFLNLGLVIAIHVLTFIYFYISFEKPIFFSALLIFAAIFLILRKKLKDFLFFYQKIPVIETSSLLVILMLFFVCLLLTSNLLSWAGILYCEWIKFYVFPKRIVAINEKESYEEKIERMNEEFRKIRAQRHDFLKHVNTINYLLSNTKENEAKAYFREIMKEYNSMNMAIKGEDGHIASLLTRIYNVASKKGIEVKYDLFVPLSGLPMRTVDQIKFLSNLLENAFEACEQFYKKYGYGRISVKTELYGGIFLLEVNNNAEFLDSKLLDSLFKRFDRTTKEGNHEGLGTYIIASLVKEYRGKLTYEYVKPTFTIKIKIPVIQEE